MCVLDIDVIRHVEEASSSWQLFRGSRIQRRTWANSWFKTNYTVNEIVSSERPLLSHAAKNDVGHGHKMGHHLTPTSRASVSGLRNMSVTPTSYIAQSSCSLRKTYTVLRDPCFIIVPGVSLPEYSYCPMGNCCSKPPAPAPRPRSPIPLEGRMVMVTHARPTTAPPTPVHRARAPPARSSHSLPQSGAESSARNSRSTSILGDRASRSTLSSYQQRQRAQSAAGGVSHRSTSSGENDSRRDNISALDDRFTRAPNSGGAGFCRWVF